MKHLLFSILCVCSLCVKAQHIIGDVNQDNKMNVTDVSALVEMLKTNRQTYLDCCSRSYIDSLFSIVYVRLDSIERKNKISYPYQTNATFPISKKRIVFGENYVQNVLTNSTGKITYSTSNPLVATVNENTGEITTISYGIVTITANIVKNECYSNAAASYSLSVFPAKGRATMNGHPYVDIGLFDGTLWSILEIGSNKYGYHGNTYTFDEALEIANQWGGKWKLPSEEDVRQLMTTLRDDIFHPNYYLFGDSELYIPCSYEDNKVGNENWEFYRHGNASFFLDSGKIANISYSTDVGGGGYEHFPYFNVLDNSTTSYVRLICTY